jgi:hypothetical protein
VPVESCWLLSQSYGTPLRHKSGSCSRTDKQEVLHGCRAWCCGGRLNPAIDNFRTAQWHCLREEVTEWPYKVWRCTSKGLLNGMPIIDVLTYWQNKILLEAHLNPLKPLPPLPSPPRPLITPTPVLFPVVSKPLTHKGAMILRSDSLLFLHRRLFCVTKSEYRAYSVMFVGTWTVTTVRMW